MRVSSGAGIRWLSPIGPLRIEIGFPLNAQTGDQIQTDAVFFWRATMSEKNEEDAHMRSRRQ